MGFDPDAYLKSKGQSQAGFDPDAYLEQKTGQKTDVEAFGVEQANFGDKLQSFLSSLTESMSLDYDEDVIPKLEAAKEKIASKITGQEYDPNTEENYRQYYKQWKEGVKQKAPGAGMAGTVTGYVAPGMAVSRTAKAFRGAMGLVPEATSLLGKAATIGGEGAAIGLAQRPSTEQDIVNIPERLRTAGEQAMFGAALPPAFKGVGVLWKKTAAPAIKWMAETGSSLSKKALSSLGGVNEEAITAFLKDPNRYLNGESKEQVLDTIGAIVDDLYTRVEQGKLDVQDAKDALKFAGQNIKEKLGDKHTVAKDYLKQAQEQLKSTFEDVKYEHKTYPAPTHMADEVQDSMTKTKEGIIEKSGESYKILDDITAQAERGEYSKQALSEMEAAVKQGKPGKRGVKRNEAGEAIGSYSDPSTYPDWFKGKGYSRKQVLNLIRKKKKGGKLTEKQEAQLDQMFKDYAEDVSQKRGYSPGGDIEVEEIVFGLNKKIEKLAERESDLAKKSVKKLQKYRDAILRKSKDGSLDAREAKNLIKDVDNDVSNWNASKMPGSFDDLYNKELKGIRALIDQELKGKFPEYESKMAEVAESSKFLGEVSKRFGTEQKLLAKLKNIHRDSGEIDRELLDQLGKRTGKDFTTAISEYKRIKDVLKDPKEMERLLKELPEYDVVQKAKAAEKAAAMAKAPKHFQKLVKKTDEFKNLKTKQSKLDAIKKEADKLKGWTERSINSRIKAVLRKDPYVTKQLIEMSKMTDKDLVKMLNTLRVKEAFEGEYRAGSKHVNLWAVIGSVGGFSGLFTGAIFGSMVDRYGPKMTKNILRVVAKMKNRPKVTDFVKKGVSKEAANELVDLFYTQTIMGFGKERRENRKEGF